MKIVTTLICLLAIAVGINIYSSHTERDRLETALSLLDARISNNTSTLEKVEDYMVDTSMTFEDMQYIMMDNIKDVATALENHEHAPVYVEVPAVPEVPSVEITTKTEPVEEETLTRIYDEETQLHVPSFPVEEKTDWVAEQSSCPKANNRLGQFINDVSIRKDYEFVATYDVVNSSIDNIRFDKTLPNNLKFAVSKFIRTFQPSGDKLNCKIIIKVLEN
tara:strand:- start:363 stop:1022 length:660 start_codon:yes stop_codon:yes gene_type:complete